MKAHTSKTTIFTIPLGIITGLTLGYFLFAQPSKFDSGAEKIPSETETWTCSMHPQVNLQVAGPCPICGMDLIPLSSMGDHGAEGTLSLSPTARALASIKTTAVRKGSAEKEIRLFGKVSYDETRLRTISARFPARIEKLYVNATGIPVNQGDHLALVYSKDLLAAQTDLITALKFSSREDAASGPKEQLRQWGFSEKRILEIESSLVAQEFLEIDAPIGGTVIAKSIQEGDHVMLGANFFTIADLTHVWIEFDAYESDLPWIHYGQEFDIIADANPGQTFTGKVSLIYPEIDPISRTAKIRVSIPNPDQLLKPGQFVRGLLKATLNEFGKVVVPNLSGKWISPMHPEIVKDESGSCDVCGMALVPAADMGLGAPNGISETLLVPSSAVLKTGKRAVVYVEEQSENGPVYEGREIVLGVRASDEYVVLSGLQEGEQVVTQGAFKIDSALQIQAKPSMMNPDGEGPVPGHNHGDEVSVASETQPETTADGLSISADLAKKIMPHYLKLQSNLASDDLAASKEPLKAMMEVTGHSGALPDLIHTLLAADSLDTMRKPHFDTLSAALIKAVQADSHAFEGDLYQIHCPMVYGSTGADWIQSSDSLRNPYFGAMMLTCGEVKTNLTSHEGHGH